MNFIWILQTVFCNDSILKTWDNCEPWTPVKYFRLLENWSFLENWNLGTHEKFGISGKLKTPGKLGTPAKLWTPGKLKTPGKVGTPGKLRVSVLCNFYHRGGGQALYCRWGVQLNQELCVLLLLIFNSNFLPLQRIYIRTVFIQI